MLKCVCVLAAALLACARADPVLIDFAKVGPEFSGIGGLSGGGGTSRLLFDYPEAQRADILDALFAPNSGAAVSILKVEIGGDTQSTEATEASHMHTRDDLNYERGYEWWLMVEAKKRNPNIKLYGLSWGVPGWIGNGSYFSQDNIDYHIKWLNGAKNVYGLTIDYLGLWNERQYDTKWTIDLRAALNANGYSNIKIVAADDGGWDVCKDLANNPAFSAAVDIVGSHYPITGENAIHAPPDECKGLPQPLWTSEGWNLGLVADWQGAANLGWTINTNYVRGNMTAMVVWTVIYSWYYILPFSRGDGTVGGAGHGLMYATEPWSGHYTFQPAMFAVAHTTQFAYPGCHYLLIDGVGINGYTDATYVSSIVAFLCPEHISIVIETTHAKAPQNITIMLQHLPGNIPPPSVLHAWHTSSLASFERLPDINVTRNTTSIIIQPDSFYTLTTSTGQGAPRPRHANPPSAHFALPYSDDFESYVAEGTVKYFADEGGSWNAAVDSTNSTNMVLEQVVTQLPIAWEANPLPYTIMGDVQAWADYTISVDARAAYTAPPGPAVAYQAVIDTCDAAKAAQQQWIWDAGRSLIRLSSNDSLCLGIYGDVASFPGNPDAVVVPCTSGVPVEWLYDAARKAFNPKSMQSSCLDVLGQKTDPGTTVFTYPCTYQSNEQWVVDGYHIVSANGNMCLTVGPEASFTSKVYVQVCGRIDSYQRNGAPPQGLCLRFADDGTWDLSNGGDKVASGTHPYTPQWHHLALAFAGSSVRASIDGTVVATADTVARKAGMVALGCGWHKAQFDNVAIVTA